MNTADESTEKREKWMRSVFVHLKWVCLVSGVIIGSSLGMMLVSFNHLHSADLTIQMKFNLGMEPMFNSGQSLADKIQNVGTKKDENKETNNFGTWSGYNNTADNNFVAERLQDKIRVLCWVWCSGRDIHNQTLAIHKTWGRKCNKVLIFTDVPFPGVNVIELTKADVTYSTSRYIIAYRYVYKHYNGDAEWFFGTFDETYVCMENLRLFLSKKDTNQSVYYGHKLALEDQTVKFVDARVGCILSKEALRLLGTTGSQTVECNQMIPAGEKQLGACMNNIGVTIGDSVDIQGRTLFLSFAPSIQMQGSQSSWFMDQDVEGLGKGVDSISPYAITFSGMTSFFMYGIECYLYHMRPFGIFPVDRAEVVNGT